MSQEVERYQAPQIEDLKAWANELYQSGVFTDITTASQAFVKIAAGAELGLSPFQSITGMHFIQGKPVVGAGLLAAMLDRPPYDYRVEWEPSIENPTACIITVSKHGVERGAARFSLEDAQRAGLMSGANWKKYPDDMLFARAVSKAARRFAPGGTGTTFYVEAHGESEIPGPSMGVTFPPESALPKVTGYADPDDPLDDVPFEIVAPAAPTAESPPLPTGPDATDEQPAAQPGTLSGGLFIDNLAAAKEFVKPLNGEQLGILKRLLHIEHKTTKVELATELLAQKFEYHAEDVLIEMAGCG